MGEENRGVLVFNTRHHMGEDLRQMMKVGMFQQEERKGLVVLKLLDSLLSYPGLRIVWEELFFKGARQISEEPKG